MGARVFVEDRRPYLEVSAGDGVLVVDLDDDDVLGLARALSTLRDALWERTRAFQCEECRSVCLPRHGIEARRGFVCRFCVSDLSETAAIADEDP